MNIPREYLYLRTDFFPCEAHKKWNKNKILNEHFENTFCIATTCIKPKILMNWTGV